MPTPDSLYTVIISDQLGGNPPNKEFICYKKGNYSPMGNSPGTHWSRSWHYCKYAKTSFVCSFDLTQTWIFINQWCFWFYKSTSWGMLGFSRLETGCFTNKQPPDLSHFWSAQNDMFTSPASPRSSWVDPFGKKKHRGAGSWYTIYHLPVVKGVSEETPLLINKPMGNLCFHVASRQSWKLNRSTLQHLHEKGICFAQTLTNYLLV